jgi:hypothetical protein
MDEFGNYSLHKVETFSLFLNKYQCSLIEFFVVSRKISVKIVLNQARKKSDNLLFGQKRAKNSPF